MHLPVSAGLGLDGPGALDAARGLLVASLTAGSPDDPDAQGQVVIPGSTLATLLGISAVDLPRMRRLTVTANTGDAITEIEEEIIRRTRIVTDHDVDDIAALREAHPLAEPLPQLLLLCDVPEPPSAAAPGQRDPPRREGEHRRRADRRMAPRHHVDRRRRRRRVR